MVGQALAIEQARQEAIQLQMEKLEQQQQQQDMQMQLEEMQRGGNSAQVRCKSLPIFAIIE